jgi:regulator of nucleoside diphosphate kinase
MIEVNHAEIVPDDAPDIELIVRIGSWVNFWSKSDLAHISVLSRLGAALIGRHVGDQMPYFIAAACTS